MLCRVGRPSCAAARARSLVHVSAIGADPASESRYGRSKGEGEAAVRTAFPAATIVRPSIVFGPEDDFVNRFARMARMLPFVPVLRGSWRLAPLYAADLGKAIALAALEPEKHAGKTYELAGPLCTSIDRFGRQVKLPTISEDARRGSYGGCFCACHRRSPRVSTPTRIGIMTNEITRAASTTAAPRWSRFLRLRTGVLLLKSSPPKDRLRTGPLPRTGQQKPPTHCCDEDAPARDRPASPARDFR